MPGRRVVGVNTTSAAAASAVRLGGPELVAHLAAGHPPVLDLDDDAHFGPRHRSESSVSTKSPFFDRPASRHPLRSVRAGRWRRERCHRAGLDDVLEVGRPWPLTWSAPRRAPSGRLRWPRAAPDWRNPSATSARNWSAAASRRASGPAAWPAARRRRRSTSRASMRCGRPPSPGASGRTAPRPSRAACPGRRGSSPGSAEAAVAVAEVRAKHGLEGLCGAFVGGPALVREALELRPHGVHVEGHADALEGSQADSQRALDEDPVVVHGLRPEPTGQRPSTMRQVLDVDRSPVTRQRDGGSGR
jgi:hypothetical protein